MNVKYFGSTAPFFRYNGSDKNHNQIEVHLMQRFGNDQNLNNNKSNSVKIPKKNLQPEISQPILSKNDFVKQIWPLTDCTATRSDSWS